MTLTIGIDIGGTKIAGAVVDETGKILSRERKESPTNDRKQIIDVVVQICQSLMTDHQVSAVGISSAGFINRERTQIMFSPNLDLTGSHIVAELKAELQLPVRLENDANCAAWGEFNYGAGKTASNMVMLTVGTGLGCGIVIENQLIIGGYGMAGEAGHMVIKPEGQLCGCGQRGCLEQYASGQALTRNARSFVASGSPGAAMLLKECSGDPNQLTGPMVTAAAAEGDPASISILAEAGKWLGYGMAALAAVLDPEIFVVGGGGGDAGDLILQPAREAFEQRLSSRDHRPIAEIVAASLGNDAGMVGVADLVRR